MFPRARPPDERCTVIISEDVGVTGVWSNGFVHTRYAPALIALAYFAGGTVLYALDLSSLTGGDGVLAVDGGALWPRIAVLAAVCAPILLRRRYPVLGLAIATGPLVADALLGPSVPVWLAYGDVLYAAVLGGSALVRVALERFGVVVVGAVAVWAAVATGDVAAGVLVAGVGTLLVLTPIWWAGSLRRQREAADVERARADAEREKSAALSRVAELDRSAAVEEERRTLARDLHDVIAGHLSAIAIQSEAALSLRGRDPDRALAVLDSVRANSVDALDEMQSMIGLLRGTGDEAATAGRLAGLTDLVDSARASGTEVLVDFPDDARLGDMGTQVDLTAYRIVQESLTNAIKHAHGQTVDLRIEVAQGFVEIRCSNALADSRDEVAARLSGRGIGNIAERAQAVGGRAAAGIVGDRWRVTARLPVEEPGGVGVSSDGGARRGPVDALGEF